MSVFNKVALPGALLCAFVLVLMYSASTTAAEFYTPPTLVFPIAAAGHQLDSTHEVKLGDIFTTFQKNGEAVREGLRRVAMADLLADSTTAAISGNAAATSSAHTETPITTTTTTTTMTTSTTTSTATPTTTTSKKPTTTTTSSRVPNPATTAAPKVAQWTGISVAVVAVIGLIVGLVLCKLKSKQQCCFAPKPRKVVVIPSDEGASRGSKNPSDTSSLTSRGSERSFHEAAVDQSVPRRSLLHMNAPNANASRDGGELLSDDDDDDDDDVIASATGNTPTTYNNFFHDPAAMTMM
jgi:hypothetical protein